MEENQPDSNTTVANNTSSRLVGYPENDANAFDDAGKIHFEICDAYLNGNQDLFSVADAISRSDGLAAVNADFQSIKPTNYLAPTQNRMLYLLSDTPGRLAETLSQTALTWRGQVSLANFISGAQIYYEQKAPYDTIYSYVIAYEASILADPLFSENERRIILTVSSIARYDYYFAYREKKKEPKRRDRDWDMSVANFTAAVDGANSGTAAAVGKGTAASLYLNR